MKLHFHSASLNYALALWLATVLALLISFVVQLEPAQWSGITVWIIFIQMPRMNYSKMIWWAFGTIVGAFVAVVLTVFFNQTPELFLLFLSLWLAVCAAISTLVSSYRAYGWVLAGYTCAIVGMSAVDHPDLIFRLAATRVSCIFIGMASAIFMIVLLLPKQRHWRETLHHLREHLRASLVQAARALDPISTQPARFTWRHMAGRLSTLEHTLDLTTAETADSRIHAPQARSLVATLFDLLAKAQAVEVHLSRKGAMAVSPEIKELLLRSNELLFASMDKIDLNVQAAEMAPLMEQLNQLREKIIVAGQAESPLASAETISDRFLLDRLGEILEQFDLALQDWLGLFGSWTARRASSLATHNDYRTAFIYGLRMFLSMAMASTFWFITQWPSGSLFILFNAVVCSLLSLMEHAPKLGIELVKSAVLCAIVAYVETFWWQPKSEGFFMLALMLGVFLLPAAYAYRHPHLIGSAVVSMLVFYGLSSPSNQMTYDIVIFLNNGVALICAVICGFFAFHAVPSLTSPKRRFWLLRAVRHDLAADGPVDVLSEQRWTSRMFDRLRLLHRAADDPARPGELVDAENEMLIGLQLGLRHHRLHTHFRTGAMTPESKTVIAGVLRQFREIAKHPGVAALFLRSTCIRFEESLAWEKEVSESTLGALAEMWEMTLLLETTTRFYLD